ncbi:glutathione S-transferase-like protein, partial [Tanacetum coccineum]
MATPPVKVFGPPLSTAVSRVLVCLLEKAVPFQLFPVSMAKGEHKKPDYLKLQPFGQVPAFQDDDITLFAGDEFTMADLSHLPNTQFLVEKTDRAELFTSRKNVGR